MSEGWISLTRKLSQHWVWTQKPFSTGQAWVSLIFKASYADHRFLLGKELITCRRGQMITSELKLMQEWGWSKTKVRSFLKILEDDEMIEKKTDRKKTTISICKYDTYQNNKTAEEPQKNREETTKEPQKDTFNKGNKGNKGNNENYMSAFDEARRMYPGTKRGLEPEFLNFKKKYKTRMADIVPLLIPAIVKQKQWREEQEKAGADFIPQWKNFQTWINQGCWTEEPQNPVKSGGSWYEPA